MRYVGLDVHWRTSTFCVLDEAGRKVMTRTVQGSWSDLITEVSRIERPFAICFEASTGYGTICERLQRIAQRVVVAHPGQLRLIFRSRQKNDRVDAEKLAKLLFLDEVPPVHVPHADVRSWRRMIEHRQNLVHERARVKNGLRSLLRNQGVEMPRGLFSKKGMAWLARVELPTELDAAAWQASRRSPRVHEFFERVKRGDRGRRKIALVATAHYLLRVMLTMLQSGEVWRPETT